MKDRKDIYWRAYLVYFAFVIFLLIVFIKTIYIQFTERRVEFTTTTESVRMPTRIVKKTPRRGQILDVNYKPLVTSVSYYDIHMDPTVVKKDTFDKYIEDLAIELNALWPEKTASEYKKSITKAKHKGSRYLLIRKRATNEERKKLRKMPIFNKGRFKGGIIDNQEHILRRRPYGELMKRTLGYVKVMDSANTKRVGLEGAFNEFLQGEYGEQVEQKISTGWKKIGPVTKEAVEGADIVTSIDKEIQEVAHSELLNQLKNQRAKNGSVIVMDVKTGFVKAIVNLVRGEDGGYYEAYNHAIGTKEVPGSTFKLASLMALLEDKKVKLSDKVKAVGRYEFYDAVLKDSREWGYGEISIQTAFEKSSNVLAKVVHKSYKNEPQRFIDRLKSFGLSEPLGIDIQGEPTPTMYEPGTKNWSGISLPWMSIGYEVQQTPLQTLAFYNAVANNGRFMKPQFVQKIRRGNEIVKEFEPITLKEQICSNNTLEQLRSCLKGVVERGTGTDLKSAYFDIAGKTGTALVLNEHKRYGELGERRYQASFAGFFPADDPIYSCIVVVSAPSEDIYGATVSGTVFTAIANKVYASSLEYHKPINQGKKTGKSLPQTKIAFRNDLEHLLEAYKVPFQSLTKSPMVVGSRGKSEILFERRNIRKKGVPNVVGMTARDAVYLIELAGLRPRISGSGIVRKQSIQAGKPVENGRIMRIELQ